MAAPTAPSARQLLEQGFALLQSGDAAAAWPVLNRAVEADPQGFDALNLAGVAGTRIGDPAAATALLLRAVAIQPASPGAWNNLGIAYRAAGQPDEAADAYQRAIRLEPRYAAAIVNLGSVQLELNRPGQALASYEQALALRPDHPETLLLSGTALARLNRPDEAERRIDRAISISPDNAAFHFARGDLMRQRRREGDALAAYGRAMELDPTRDYLLGIYLRRKLKLCDWDGFDALREQLVQRVRAGERAVDPFVSLFLLDEAADQYAVAIGQRSATPALSAAPARVERNADGRIRIGYFSSDLRNHPMMHLIGGMLRVHDRSRFHTTAFFFSPAGSDALTEDARAAVDQFIDVTAMSDAEVVELSRSRGIDIAIDCNGITTHARPGIFARRAAPVQVNYVGTPGTLGAPMIDYIVGDRTVIPAPSRKYFSEKVVWMPHCYLPRDTRAGVPERTISRADESLPDGAVVFCSFNQCVKITPTVFSQWMRILSGVPRSVLWLLDEDPVAKDNLRAAARAGAVDPERIVFAGKRPLRDHLARLQLADLCLDTFPYNAHTTASDALYVGVPILTRPGSAFASRVCASMLQVLNIPELVAADSDDYVARAIGLGRDSARLRRLREKVAVAARNSQLFDTDAYVRALETAFVTMHQRVFDRLPPDHIEL